MSEATDQSNPHAESVRKLAAAMLRSALWPSIVTVILATVVATFLVGVPGLFGALVGGAVAFASSLLTIVFMRWSAGFHPMFVMVVALGGYVVKMVVLLAVMTLLGGAETLHREALAGTMLITILVWTGAEVYGFRKTKIPTIVPGS